MRMRNLTLTIVSLVLLIATTFFYDPSIASEQADSTKDRVEDAYNFRRPTSQVHTSGVINEAQLANLKAEGYIAVINLLPKKNDNAIPSEKKIVKEQGLDYHNIQVDWENPTLKDYAKFSKIMDGYHEAITGRDPTQKVIVHCAANFRASAFLSLYAYKNLRWSEGQVTESINAVWNITDYPTWNTFVENKMNEAAL
jgi:protein tyrosine phosphatase (PTP) superfamily phosphohydrolase (DUF442 family)